MLYRYYSVLRPVAPGTYPTKNAVEIVNFDERKHIGKIGREAWGYIEYSEPLSDDAADAFDLIPANGGEDKVKICELLCKVLQKTRGASDLVSLEYDADTEIVTGTFESGGKRKINVAMDSGVAMIRDIMNHLEV